MLSDDLKELQEAWRDFVFEIGYAIGAIWIVKRIPFLKLKDWVQTRLNKKIN